MRESQNEFDINAEQDQNLGMARSLLNLRIQHAKCFCIWLIALFVITGSVFSTQSFSANLFLENLQEVEEAGFETELEFEGVDSSCVKTEQFEIYVGRSLDCLTDDSSASESAVFSTHALRGPPTC